MRPYNVAASKHQVLGRFDVHMDTLEINGELYPYSYTSVHESVTVIPVIKSEKEDRIGLIYQYRHSIDEWVYEAVAGGIEKGESPEQAAIRELKEETGYIVSEQNLLYLDYCYPVAGTSNEKNHMFIAFPKEKGAVLSEPTEFIEQKLVTAAELEKMIQEGIFRNMFGITAWYKYNIYKKFEISG